MQEGRDPTVERSRVSGVRIPTGLGIRAANPPSFSASNSNTKISILCPHKHNGITSN
ncbi:hypothetical protein HanXRQr2_Chr14g0656671 [Helianthus annuus]|uniref:Uncharacterized protein n=1 Tax=Helianthus annuus TaxID=4232 RepID=A0A9K3H7R5_HELAN|nr:hypothetical protein HanXRQr2_Chr14g0656671 [Helianthus annuus]KAJ0841374.1 hypothetical protein HanPSC8_Chr14g0629681 [Helianthus annuus]